MNVSERIHNFGAGPAVLPLSVVQAVSDALPNLMDSGIGLCEISHRSSTFQSVVDSAMARVRRVLSVPSDYTILFLQGGASLQFYMTALNILRAGEKADYLITRFEMMQYTSTIHRIIHSMGLNITTCLTVAESP